MKLDARVLFSYSNRHNIIVTIYHNFASIVKRIRAQSIKVLAVIHMNDKSNDFAEIIFNEKFSVTCGNIIQFCIAPLESCTLANVGGNTVYAIEVNVSVLGKLVCQSISPRFYFSPRPNLLTLGRRITTTGNNTDKGDIRNIQQSYLSLGNILLGKLNRLYN